MHSEDLETPDGSDERSDGTVSLASQNDPISTPAPSSTTFVNGQPPGRRTVSAVLLRRSWWLRVAAALVVVAPVVAAGGSASAARPTRPAKPPTLQQLAAKIADLREQAEKASEQYNAVRVQIQSIQVRVKAAQVRRQGQQVQVDAARKALGTIANERYRQGDFAALSLMFSNDPEALMAQSGLLATLGEREAAAVQRLVQSQRELAANDADLLAQNDRLTKAQAAADAARKDATTKVAAALLEYNRLSAAQQTQVSRYNRDVPLGKTCADINIVYPNAQVQKVIEYACVQVKNRIRYQWGGESPGEGFDCSGLTMMAWRQGGVDLPHLASAQYADGKKIPFSQARPGDLVFRNGLGHVGIYIGDGMMIHAPRTGSWVQIVGVSSGMLTARYGG